MLFFLFIFLIVLFFPFKEKFSTKNDLDVLLRLNECNKGCLDEKGRCHFGVSSLCRFNGVCYAFFDEQAKLKTPCDYYDRNSKTLEKDCKNCRYCQYCIDGLKNRSCISRKKFNCQRCPYSDGCTNELNLKGE